MDAERKMGEMLLAEAKAGRLATRQTANPTGKSLVPNRYMGVVKTSDLGITRRERSEAQQLAEMPAEKFEEAKAANDGGGADVVFGGELFGGL